MDAAARLALLQALIGEGQTSRWTPEQLADRSGLPPAKTERGVEALAAEDPPLAQFDRDARTGELLAWLLPHGLTVLDDLEREQGA